MITPSKRLRMDIRFQLFIVIAVCYAQDATDSRVVRLPPRVTNSGGECPSSAQREDIRRQAAMEAVAALNRGSSPDNPASSCRTIPAGRLSGYYWILPATGPPAVQVYCDFNRQCGCDGPSTWTRAALLNMSDPNQNCPGDLFTYTDPVRSCGVAQNTTPSCHSLPYQTHGHQYSRVCGRILGFQNGDTIGVSNLIANSFSIDQVYLDGVSLTHGSEGSRQHIWSFVSAIAEEQPINVLLCDCSNSNEWDFNTFFVGNDYFCDSGKRGVFRPAIFLSEDPLWDGAGCGGNSTCCQFNNPPWFCKTLPQPTTDDLEVRICAGSSGTTPIELIELYVQ